MQASPPSCSVHPGEAGELQGQPSVVFKTHLSFLASPMTGPTADTCCSAQAGSPHGALSTGPRAACHAVVPYSDRCPPTAPMGDAAPGVPSPPAELRSCLALPPTSTPDLRQHLCLFHIGTGHTLSNQAMLLRWGKASGRGCPGSGDRMDVTIQRHPHCPLSMSAETPQ